MRNLIRPILVASALLVPAVALGAPATGFPAVPDCTNTAQNIDSANAELYVLKITPTASQRKNDWLWNTDQKAEPASDSQALLDTGGFWSSGDVWALAQGGADMAFVFITFAPSGPGEPAELYVDSNDGASVDWGVAPLQRVGDSLPTGRDAGIGLAIPGTASTFTATVRPGVTKSFPIRTTPSGSATAGSSNIAFGTIAEVNPADAVAGACQIGGNGFNPRDNTRGAIIGYNVYRIPGTAGTVPTRADFQAAVLTDSDADGGWVYFLDLRTFNVTAADTNPGAPGTNAPSDTAPTDLAGLQNPDGRMYSGDEVVIFQDSANRSGVSRVRAAELAPVPGQSYWYAVQPVVFGTMAEYTASGFTVNDFFNGDHRMDLDGDGEFDAVSLNSVAGSHNTPEFISPQAEAENGGQEGMGLTNGGVLLLSAPMFLDGAAALPAFGQVNLSGSVTGNDVNVQFTTGLERGSVLGYNVYRVAGEQRVRVNEQPILAKGGESNVYQLADDATRNRGMRSLDYMVEIVYSDGTPSTMVGPFTVTIGSQPARRSR